MKKYKDVCAELEEEAKKRKPVGKWLKQRKEKNAQAEKSKKGGAKV